MAPNSPAITCLETDDSNSADIFRVLKLRAVPPARGSVTPTDDKGLFWIKQEMKPVYTVQSPQVHAALCPSFYLLFVQDAWKIMQSRNTLKIQVLCLMLHNFEWHLNLKRQKLNFVCFFEPLVLIKYANFNLCCTLCQFNLCYESVNSSLTPHAFSCNTLNSAAVRVAIISHNSLHVLKIYCNIFGLCIQ